MISLNPGKNNILSSGSIKIIKKEWPEDWNKNSMIWYVDCNPAASVNKYNLYEFHGYRNCVKIKILNLTVLILV